jgi:hypothetical protein
MPTKHETGPVVFKGAFRDCMRQMYPEGVPDEQLLALLRTFSLAWRECLNATGGYAQAAMWHLQHPEIVDPDWRPDLSWRWW